MVLTSVDFETCRCWYSPGCPWTLQTQWETSWALVGSRGHSEACRGPTTQEWRLTQSFIPLLKVAGLPLWGLKYLLVMWDPRFLLTDVCQLPYLPLFLVSNCPICYTWAWEQGRARMSINYTQVTNALDTLLPAHKIKYQLSCTLKTRSLTCLLICVPRPVNLISHIGSHWL